MPILPINLEAPNDDNVYLSQASGVSPAAPLDAAKVGAADNPFEALLSNAIKALDNVSQSEFRANDLIDKYIQGKADLQEVMVATSKMNIMVQLAVTTITSAVTSFKELTQMQV